jgi:hypothetical protein
MIEAGLVVEQAGAAILTLQTTFPVLPQIGQLVGFWHDRKRVFATVESIIFDQQSDGSFAVIVGATLPTAGLRSVD